MTARIALRFIIVALVAAVVLVTAGLALNRLRQQLTPTDIDFAKLGEAQLAAALMPLDANGNGAQVINGANVSVRVQPFPPAAGAPAELRLVVISRFGNVLTTLSPAAYINRAGVTEGTNYNFVAQPDGSYVVKGALFAAAGEYRIRIIVPTVSEGDYVVLLSVRAK